MPLPYLQESLVKNPSLNVYYYLVSDDDSGNKGQRGTSYAEHLANPMREGGGFGKND